MEGVLARQHDDFISIHIFAAADDTVVVDWLNRLENLSKGNPRLLLHIPPDNLTVSQVGP